jgi:hypothetical protein
MSVISIGDLFKAAAARILAQLGGALRAARRAEQIGGAAARIAGRIARATGSEDLALLADLASSEDSAQSTLVPILQFLGEPFVLPHIAREDWQHDLRERFKRADLSLEEPALERLLDLSTGQPYCTMLLARQCAELGDAFGTVNVDVVEFALPTVERHEAWQLLRYS